MDLHLSAYGDVLEHTSHTAYIKTVFLSHLERTVHRGMVGTSVGKAIFTDLDFADDVALLAQMMSVLVLALEVMNEEA